MNKKAFLSASIFFLIMASGAPVPAWSLQVTDSLRIDGFGMQGYYITSKNNYFGPNDTQGTLNFDAFNIVIKADVDSHFRVWFKLLAYSDIKDAVEVKWAFGEYYVSDRLQIRIGKIKMPLGIYSEISGIYPVLPTSLLPEIYMDTAYMSLDEFKGLSLTGRINGKHLKLFYDLYGGRSGGDLDTQGNLQVENMLGSRVWFLSPDEGLKAGLSYFHGLIASPQIWINRGLSHYQLSMEYRYHNELALRGEWALHEDDTGASSVGYYVELTYLIHDTWMPVLRYDEFYPVRGHDTQITDYQKDLVIGLNYHFSDYLVWKGESHFIQGAALLDPTLSPSPQDHWNLFITSITFLF